MASYGKNQEKSGFPEEIEKIQETANKTEELKKKKNEVISRIKDLEKIYASGDLLDEEYEELRKTLGEEVKKIDEELRSLNEIESDDSAIIRPSIEMENIRTQGQQYSNAQALWKLTLLLIFTFNIYLLYWFYRNWNHLKNHRNLDISPGWRTVGLFVPIISILLIYWQLKDIRDFALQAGCKAYSSPGSLTIGFMFVSILLRVVDRSENLAGLGFLVSFLYIPLLVFVQKTLNDYWKKEQVGLKMRTGLSYGEIALLLMGVVLWFLMIALF